MKRWKISRSSNYIGRAPKLLYQKPKRNKYGRYCHYIAYQILYNDEDADDKLIIMVNGQQVDNIPTAPGTYEITIDYSELDDLLDHVEPFVDVIGFGTFILDKEVAD